MSFVVFEKEYRHYRIGVSVYFYGNQLEESERMNAQSVVRRLSLRLGGRIRRIMFVADAMQIGGLS